MTVENVAPNQAEEKMPSHAILFIPGFDANEGRMSVYELSRVLREKGGLEDQADNGAAMRLRFDDRAAIDIYEVQWSHFVDQLSKQELIDRIRRAIFLFNNWIAFLFGRHFKNALKLRFLGALAPVFAWYVTTGVIAVSIIVKWFKDNLPRHGPLTDFLTEAFHWLAPFLDYVWWPIIFVFSIASIWVVLFPVNKTMDLINFCTIYFGEGSTKERVSEDALKTFRTRIKQGYDTVTIVGHSFGAIIGLELVARLPKDRDLRFITLGSVAGLFSQKSVETFKEITELVSVCRGRPKTEWSDFYWEADTVSVPWAPEGVYGNQKIVIIRGDREGIELRKGQAHGLYFYKDVVVTAIAPVLSDIDRTFPGDGPESIGRMI